jgi:hypothetical protein
MKTLKIAAWIFVASMAVVISAMAKPIASADSSAKAKRVKSEMKHDGSEAKNEAKAAGKKIKKTVKHSKTKVKREVAK